MDADELHEDGKSATPGGDDSPAGGVDSTGGDEERTSAAELQAEIDDLSEQLEAAHELLERSNQTRRVLAAALAEHKRSAFEPATLEPLLESLQLINYGALSALTATYQGEVDDLLSFLLDISEALGQAISAARDEQRRRAEQGELGDDEIDDLERLAAELLVEARRIS